MNSQASASSAFRPPLYPLKFRPRLLEKIWGGRKIEEVLGKPLPAGKLIGESWELFDFPPGVVDRSPDWISAEVAVGPLAGRSLHDLVKAYGPAVHGTIPLAGPYGQFPILIKFLDAREDLSVQVHPDARYAAAHADAHLKSEAWYVVQSDKGAGIYKGLSAGTTREKFSSAIESGEVMDHIQRVPVQAGDCHYLPSGTVHALGAGILVAEVQTPSDTTFRVFDFNRIDQSTGKPRALHVEWALECINFSDELSSASKDSRESSPARMSRLVTSPYFELDKLVLNADMPQPLTQRQPIVWIMLEGSAKLSPTDGGLETISVARGDTVLLPAEMPHYTVEAQTPCVLLQVSFPSAG